MTDKIEGERFFGKTAFCSATPLLLVLILVELSDVDFAVDSIPAIFAVTTDPVYRADVEPVRDSSASAP